MSKLHLLVIDDEWNDISGSLWTTDIINFRSKYDVSNIQAKSSFFENKQG